MDYLSDFTTEVSTLYVSHHSVIEEAQRLDISLKKNPII